jgi:hypothetical protein
MVPPDMLPGADALVSAFWELSSDRQIGMNLGVLPASSIDRWAQANGLDGDEIAEAVECFRAMDAVFLGREAPPTPEAKPKPKARALSMDLFDALWG